MCRAGLVALAAVQATLTVLDYTFIRIRASVGVPDGGWRMEDGVVS